MKRTARAAASRPHGRAGRAAEPQPVARAKATPRSNEQNGGGRRGSAGRGAARGKAAARAPGGELGRVVLPAPTRHLSSLQVRRAPGGPLPPAAGPGLPSGELPSGELLSGELLAKEAEYK